MPLDASIAGWKSGPRLVTWDSTRAILYALGVGAGTVPGLDELAFVTENTAGVTQRVLPTFPVLLGQGLFRVPYGDVDLSKLVHAEQSVELLGEITPSGSGRYHARVTGVYDKGSGALVRTEGMLTGEDGAPLARLTGGSFIRGEGGFGGDRGPSSDWTAPGRPPDVVIEQQTVPWQALLYRLSGDRNRLHSDPGFAAAGGFPRPILHGMCTYGIAGRALLHGAAGGDPARFQAMSARFSAPVVPGDTLRTSIWREGDDVLFMSHTGAGTAVLTQGRAVIAGAGR
ncbi:MAG TPA: MaoC/PaaZ C-terminal domain-containing protein [Trebonia sp.]|nr:MaoC/PaaZ C-terminal domain-containing protein [Trebonia sp.]